MSPRIFCYDTEFLEDGRTIELISIGIVCDDGNEYYAVNSDMPMSRVKENDWLIRNVLPSLPVTGRVGLDDYIKNPSNFFPRPHISLLELDFTDLRVKPKWVIANEVREFITECVKYGDSPQLWADYGAYDHVVLAQLYGPMSELPDGIPMFTHELRQLLETLPGSWTPPDRSSTEHNALEDARYIMELYKAARGYL